MPVLIREPQPSFVTLSGTGQAGAAPHTGTQLTALAEAPTQDDTASFVAYQRFINAAAQRGFNRLVGGKPPGACRCKADPRQ